jgi:hypothetical protein
MNGTNRTPALGRMPSGTPTRHSPLNVQQLPRPTQIQLSRRPPKPLSLSQTYGDRYLEPDLAVAAMLRDVAGPPEQTDADINRMFTRAMAWRECPVSEERMVEVNQLSLAYFRRHLPSSWAQQYLADRFGADITNDIRFQPGHAPAGWTNLVDHLRRHAVTDQEMLITGVATMASTGRLIDRFRDRVVFPIIHRRPDSRIRRSTTPRPQPMRTGPDLNTSTPATPRCSTRARSCSAHSRPSPLTGPSR